MSVQVPPLRILASKFAVPSAASTHLPRQHLLEQMEQADAARLILIRAAAGFGKTTLLQQYRERSLGAGRQVLWLNLDAADNDLLRFVTHLSSGLHQLDGSAPAENACRPQSMQDLLEELSDRTQPFALLFDEFEAVNNPAVLSFVQQLIDALPSCGVLLIASRATPDIGLGRIRARGQLLEINPGALRFSIDEATRFIRDKRQLPLRDNEIATLHRCTEGWITAIYLASLSLQDRTDHAAFVASFSGSNLELAEYLAEDILARQNDECREFLLQTSVLDRLTAPLCDAVTGQGNGQAMLEYLERANLFIFPVDNEHQWFRYHSLFASYLRDALERRHPGRSTELHRSAAHWYLAQGRPVPAIDHLLHAQERELAARHLAEHIKDLIDAGRSRLLLRWLDQVPATVLREYPAVCLAYSWALAVHRRYSDAHKAIGLLERSTDELPQALQAETIRCMLLALTDQVEECCVASLAHIQRLPEEEQFQYGVTANSLAYSLIATGRYEEARSLLSRAILRCSQNRMMSMGGVANSIEAVLELVQGRLGNALARLQAASQQHWGKDNGQDPGGRPSLECTLGTVLYETDSLDEAAQLLDDVLPSAKESSPPDSLISSHVLLARITLLRGDRDSWLRHLADLEQIGQQAGSARAICSAWLERARVATLENRLDAAAQALRYAELHGDWEQPGILHYGNDVDIPSIARLRLRIARGDYAEPEQQLREAMTAARQRQHQRRELKLRLLHALALDGLGRSEEAFDELTEALCFASHEGFLRTFLDEGPRLGSLLQRWAVTCQAQSRALGIEPRYLATLLQRFAGNGETPSQGAAAGSGGEALTSREIQVIRLLAAGHRNKVIAEKMFLSEFTVKSHLRNINAKLGAQGRTEAVAIARARGMLD
ncbi:LuxR family transcriptional regulator [Pseudomonas sp. ATCC 13867]|uniref:LuxR C-terminal-related transcriptional regulator n=1 Tax=Pseudomonas sp. ATCC 13867 TaxID=1294143 RepID=UPI0002C4E161|nr:LuxR C-terminal-related transcriptional regulator [Pseudomonas sp. ATCC 13867]AGI24329.1 LuxR family transcriptional regulator [Pseudomonas sp. ATCC 13867]